MTDDDILARKPLASRILGAVRFRNPALAHDALAQATTDDLRAVTLLLADVIVQTRGDHPSKAELDRMSWHARRKWEQQQRGMSRGLEPGQQDALRAAVKLLNDALMDDHKTARKEKAA